jgi:signal transduction histidine kinase
VQPDRLLASPKAGALNIEEIVADGRRFQPVPELRLPPRTALIDINYAMISLTAPSNFRFRYRLEGFDSDWEDAGSRRQARYTNLSPGAYRFRVVYGSSEGGWSESGAALDFSILPALYQTRGFLFLSMSLTLFAIACAWRLRMLLVQRRFELVLAERARIARDIHDTLLQSLAAVALDFDDIASQLEPSAHSLRAYITHARERVEHYVHETRQSIWNLRSPALETNGLVEALRKVADRATGRFVKYECLVRGMPSRVSVDIEEQLLRIGQESVMNAVRHGKADVVRIELVYEAKTLTLRVTDDGSGFDVERADGAEQGHWGLANMRERAQCVGAHFNIVSLEGKGTTVEVVVPFSAAT